jgi:hypothetical protein
MKRSEKILLGLFGIVFLVIVGGGLLAFGIRSYREVLAENDRLTDRLSEMHQAIAEGSEWQRRHEWLDASVPSFSSRQEASSRLLETIQREADHHSLSLSGKEFIEPIKQLAQDGQPVEEASGYFDQATVKIILTKVKEQALFAWMHGLQKPELFLGITRLQITPGGEGKTVSVEAEVTQFYREKVPSKLSKANTGGQP